MQYSQGNSDRWLVLDPDLLRARLIGLPFPVEPLTVCPPFRWCCRDQRGRDPYADRYHVSYAVNQHFVDEWD